MTTPPKNPIAALAATTCLALTSLPSAAQADQPLAPIDSHPQRGDPTYLMDRCEDLTFAVIVYGQILSSNPVYGRDRSRKAPFAWAAPLGATIRKHRGAHPRQHKSMVDAYMADFGPIAVPTLVPNMALYQSDKATCLKAFGAGHDQPGE